MSRPPVVGTISATGQTSLPCPVTDRVASYLIQFQSSSFDGSVTIKGAASDSAFTLAALAYKNMILGENSTSAITGNALVLVDASGITVVLDATTVSSGTLAFRAIPLVG